MAELTAFAYQPGGSILHRLDVRMKLALVAAASLISLRLDFQGIGLMALPLLAVAVCGRRRIQADGLRWIALLLAFVFVARALSADGAAIFSFIGLDITHEGLREGALVSLRLALVFMVGTLLMATTRPTEIKSGVQWFLGPLPFVPAERIGTMLGLLVRFVPVIFAEVSQTSDAQRARAVENRRNPLVRAVKLGIPIMGRIFERTDRLVLAMEARCYSESRSPVAFKTGFGDWAVFVPGCGWLAFLLTL